MRTAIDRTLGRASHHTFRAFTLAFRHIARFIGRLGFGRQGALVAGRRLFPARAHTPARRAVSLFAGSLFIGIGVALLQQANLGLTPYDVLVSGLQPRIGLSFGQTVWVVSAVLFAAAAMLRQFPSRWGIAYVFANGVAIDSVSGFINAPESLLARCFFVALSLISLSAGISLVVHSGSTGGAFELLMRAGELRGMNRQMVRTSLEVGIFACGLVLGGSFGPATLVIALGIGPLLGLTSQALADHSRGRVIRQLESTPVQGQPSAATSS